MFNRNADRSFLLFLIGLSQKWLKPWVSVIVSEAEAYFPEVEDPGALQGNLLIYFMSQFNSPFLISQLSP